MNLVSFARTVSSSPVDADNATDGSEGCVGADKKHDGCNNHDTWDGGATKDVRRGKEGETKTGKP